jgi:arsenate reductase-like glutaredoxin family protein
MTQEDIYISSDLVSADDIRDEEQFKNVTSDLSDEQLERLANTLKEAHSELMADSDDVLSELEDKLDEVDRLHAEAKELNETSSMVVNRLIALNVEYKVREMERNTE